jgi:hypothetical protein
MAKSIKIRAPLKTNMCLIIRNNTNRERGAAVAWSVVRKGLVCLNTENAFESSTGTNVCQRYSRVSPRKEVLYNTVTEFGVSMKLVKID